MSETMQPVNRYPDVFTVAEALEYMHLPADSERTLDTLREKGLLRGEMVGRTRLFHRRELEGCYEKLFAYAAPHAPSGKRGAEAHGLRLTGSR